MNPDSRQFQPCPHENPSLSILDNFMQRGHFARDFFLSFSLAGAPVPGQTPLTDSLVEMTNMLTTGDGSVSTDDLPHAITR